MLLTGISFVNSDTLEAPTNIRLSEVTCTSVTVSWDEVDGTTDYEIEYESINDNDVFHSSGQSRFTSSRTSDTLQLQIGESVSRQYSIQVSSLQNELRSSAPLIIFSTNCSDNGSNINGNKLVVIYVCDCTVEPLSQDHAVIPIPNCTLNLWLQ